MFEILENNNIFIEGIYVTLEREYFLSQTCYEQTKEKRFFVLIIKTITIFKNIPIMNFMIICYNQ